MCAEGAESAGPERAAIITGRCATVLATLEEGSLDAVITDPPFLVNYKGRWSAKHHIEGDREDDWLEESFAAIYRALKPDSFCVSFYGWPQAEKFYATWKRCGFLLLSHFVFVKNQQGLGYFTRGKHEQAILLAKGKPPKPVKALPDVLPFTRVRRARHCNEKPLDSLRPLVELVSAPGDLLCDPFCGSASCGEAALSLGRRFLGIDLDPAHVATARERLGLTAVPLSA